MWENTSVCCGLLFLPILIGCAHGRFLWLSLSARSFLLCSGIMSFALACKKQKVTNGAENQAIIGSNDLTSNIPENLKPNLVKIISNKGKAYCSGVVVSPKYVAMASHCFPFRKGAKFPSMTIENSQGKKGVLKNISTVFSASDFLVAELIEPFAVNNVNILPPKTQDKVFVAGFSSQNGKFVKSALCSVAADTSPGITKLTYECDSLEGMSGAGVFTEDGKSLVGIHVGFEKKSQKNIGVNISKMSKKNYQYGSGLGNVSINYEGINILGTLADILVKPEQTGDTIPPDQNSTLCNVVNAAGSLLATLGVPKVSCYQNVEEKVVENLMTPCLAEPLAGVRAISMNKESEFDDVPNFDLVVAADTKLWPRYSQFRVRFIGEYTQEQRNRFMEGANAWSRHSGISFVESSELVSELRVRLPGAGNNDPGNHSFVGQAALTNSMEKSGKVVAGFQANLPNLSIADIEENSNNLAPFGTIMHEVGHFLGLAHEQLSPAFNKEFVYEYYQERVKWSKERVDANIFAKIDAAKTLLYSTADFSSIMQYSFPAKFFKDGVGVPGSNSLSITDQIFIGYLYPAGEGKVCGGYYAGQHPPCDTALQLTCSFDGQGFHPTGICQRTSPVVIQRINSQFAARIGWSTLQR